MAEKEGPGWKEKRATAKLNFLLKLIGKTAPGLAESKVLIVNDGPLQTLHHLQARSRVAIDPATDALIDLGLLEPEPSGEGVRYLSASIVDNTLAEREFDVIIVSCPVRGPYECLRLLKAIFRVGAPYATVALNIYGYTDDAGLSLDLVKQALGVRPNVQDLILVPDKITIRGSVLLLA